MIIFHLAESYLTLIIAKGFHVTHLAKKSVLASNEEEQSISVSFKPLWNKKSRMNFKNYILLISFGRN